MNVCIAVTKFPNVIINIYTRLLPRSKSPRIYDLSFKTLIDNRQIYIRYLIFVSR